MNVSFLNLYSNQLRAALATTVGGLPWIHREAALETDFRGIATGTGSPKWE
jgi:hypothetical protein